MSFIKQTFKNTASLVLAAGIIGTAYAAISTVNSGDTLTASSWNEIVSKLTNTDTNSTDLVTKSYVDSTVSASSGGWYPLTNGISSHVDTPRTLMDSITYCENLTEWGYTNWRMPTFEELYRYIDSSESTRYNWTSTPSNTNRNYYVTIYLREWHNNHSAYNHAGTYVRCVR